VRILYMAIFVTSLGMIVNSERSGEWKVMSAEDGRSKEISDTFLIGLIAGSDLAMK